MMMQGFGIEEAKPVPEEQHHPHRSQQEKSMPARVDVQSQFTDPPAPPPQQPLPEKPDAARSGGDHQSEAMAPPGLRRSETERAARSSAHSSPTKTQPTHQIVSLVEALAEARREIDTQATRVKDLEGMLREERMARESAEDRAKRLEKERQDGGDSESSHGRQPSGTEKILESLEGGGGVEQPEGSPEGSETEARNQSNGVIKAVENEKSTSDQHEAMARLQRRLESMMADMKEMKQTVETYKRRAEAAEAESASSRQSLAEMVERIRRMEAEREERSSSSQADGKVGLSSKTKKSDTEGTTGDDADGSILPSNSSVRSDGLRNGRLVQPGRDGDDDDDGVLDQSTSTSGAGSTALTRSLRTPHDHFMQSAPYASILGVVALGVGLMAYLNGWQKVDR